jgi:hypothetical protein
VLAHDDAAEGGFATASEPVDPGNSAAVGVLFAREEKGCLRGNVGEVIALVFVFYWWREGGEGDL